jgi:CubicO group peptidase (beta-lactamase class C family)
MAMRTLVPFRAPGALSSPVRLSAAVLAAVAVTVRAGGAGGAGGAEAILEEAADFLPARQLLEAAVLERAFPGCSVAVGTSRGPLWIAGFGRLEHGAGPEVTPRTLYDLASLTKVIGTTSVVLALVEKERLRLTDRLVEHVPEFAVGGDPRRLLVTIEHLLTHSSGLPAWRPYYREAEGYRPLLERVLATPLESEPGKVARYSDIGFILLGEAAARAGGKPLPVLERELVLDPLGLRDTRRRPPSGWEDEIERIAPTEVTGAPPAAIHGLVHDENARAGEGITGHAGLFSSAEDLARFAVALLRAWRGEDGVFSQSALRLFTARRLLVEGSSRALGWDTPSEPSSAGTLLGPRAFGHTGFTGTSLWLDPERDLFILLLSNRVHPSRENPAIARVRAELADRVVLGLEGRLRRL